MTNFDRVVILVDMDCFYCQVEEQLDPNLKGKPIAVVQYNDWRGGGIIAVNYPARDLGVTRHMRGDDAKKQCPDIQLVKVPQVRGKADLTKYRDAGKKVADVLQTFTTLLERASVDEAYLDVTELVQKRTAEYMGRVDVQNLPNTFIVGSSVEDFLHNNFENGHFAAGNIKLAIGAVIAEEIRAEVFKKTGYNCSAGIAHNKILAKLVCGLHKPNKQTVLPHDAISKLYEKLPVRKIRSLGGKLGNTVSDILGIQYMGELHKFSEKDLIKKFDEKTGSWLYNIARGIDTDPVTTRLVSKSIGCCKKFPGRTALRTTEDVEHWINELSQEISERLSKDFEENNRRAKQMVVSFAQEVKGQDVNSSRTHPLNSYESNKIAQNMLDVLRRFCMRADGSYHIKFLGLSVGSFEDIKKVTAITSFFKTADKKVEPQNEKIIGSYKRKAPSGQQNILSFINTMKSEHSLANSTNNACPIGNSTNNVCTDIGGKCNNGYDNNIDKSSLDAICNVYGYLADDNYDTESPICSANNHNNDIDKKSLGEICNVLESLADDNCDTDSSVWSANNTHDNDIDKNSAGDILHNVHESLDDENYDSDSSIWSAATEDLNIDTQTLVYYGEPEHEEVHSQRFVTALNVSNQPVLNVFEEYESCESKDSISEEILSSNSSCTPHISGQEAPEAASFFQSYFNTKEETPVPKSFFQRYFDSLKEKRIANSLVERQFDTSKILENVESDNSLDDKITETVTERVHIQRSIDLNTDTEAREICPQCGKSLLKQDLLSHMDYHFALQMVKQESHLHRSQPYPSNETKPPPKTNKQAKQNGKKTKQLKGNAPVIKSVSIRTFLHKDDVPLEECEICAECNKRIKLEEVASHKDYHIAKKLYLDLKTFDQTDNAIKNNFKAKHKVKSGSKISVGSISSFFKPL